MDTKYIIKELKDVEYKCLLIYNFLCKINAWHFLDKTIWRICEIDETVSSLTIWLESKSD